MNIEIHRPELEALIRERMEAGGFKSIEDVLMHALAAVPLVESGLTGAALIAAMQSCPVKDFSFDSERYIPSVSDVKL